VAACQDEARNPDLRSLVLSCLSWRPPRATGDWPMWGGTPGRNIGLADAWPPHSWDAEAGRNVKVGGGAAGPRPTQSVVAAARSMWARTTGWAQSREDGDRGVLMCFRESDGQFLWQHTTGSSALGLRLGPTSGSCSAPLVEGDRLYYVSPLRVAGASTQGDGKGNAPGDLAVRHESRKSARRRTTCRTRRRCL